MSRPKDINNITEPVYKRLKSELVEDVNAGIQAGNIAVGTKLYKHRIIFTNTDDGEDVSIELISTLGDVVNDFVILTNVLNKAVDIRHLTRMAIDAPPPESYTCIGYDDQYTPQIKYLNGNIIETYILEIDYIENYTDTVLPL